MSDGTPTKVLPAVQPGFRPREPRPSRGPMIAFIIVAVLVVAALVALGSILINRMSTPIAVPTNSAPATPATTPAPAPVVSTPPPPAGSFTSLVAQTTEQCFGHGRRRQPPVLTVAWSTTDATQVWIAQGAGDAVAAGQQVPLSGDQSSFSPPLTVNCHGNGNDNANVFTMTLVGDNGAHVSRTWTVTTSEFGFGNNNSGNN